MRTSVKLKPADPGSPHICFFEFYLQELYRVLPVDIGKKSHLASTGGGSSYFEIRILFFFISPVVRRNHFFFSGA